MVNTEMAKDITLKILDKFYSFSSREMILFKSVQATKFSYYDITLRVQGIKVLIFFELYSPFISMSSILNNLSTTDLLCKKCHTLLKSEPLYNRGYSGRLSRKGYTYECSSCGKQWEYKRDISTYSSATSYVREPKNNVTRTAFYTILFNVVWLSNFFFLVCLIGLVIAIRFALTINISRM